MVVVASAVLTGHGVSAVSIPMRTGQAWLANAENGTVSLVDGFSGGSIGQARAAEGPGRLSVINTSSGAVIVDSAGHMNRVANSTMSAGRPRTIFTNTTGVAGAKAIFAVDESSGQVQELRVENTLLEPVGRQVSLGAPISSAVVDNADHLWVALPQKGYLASVKNGTSEQFAGVGSPGDDLHVVTAAARAVAVDLTSRTVTPIGFASVVHLPPSPPTGAAMQIVGSDTLSQVALIASDAVLAVDLAKSSVRSTALPAGTQPGAAVMVGSNVDLIDKSSGGIVVVHTDTGRVDAPIRLPQGRPDEILVKEGQVFVNDSTGASALVLHPDGSTSDITKYTPASTQRALHPPKAMTAPPAPAKTQLPGNKGAGAATGPAPSRGPGTGGGISSPGKPSPSQSAPSKPAPSKPAPSKPAPVESPKPGAPGVPGNLTLSAQNATITAVWAAASPNGSPIDSYTVAWDPATGRGKPYVLHVRKGIALTYPITGLDNGTSYSVTVTAHNHYGNGLPAQAGPVTPSGDVPSAPTGVTAAVSVPGRIDVSWQPSDHGYHIASYDVYLSTGATPVMTGVTQTSTAIDYAGPFDGTPITATVKAINATGTVSNASQPSVAVTPFGQPQPPSVSSMTSTPQGTSETIVVTCDDTCRQATDAKQFALQLSPVPSGGQPASVDASSNGATVTVDGLQAGTNYALVTTVTTAGGTAAVNSNFTTHGSATVSGFGSYNAGDGRTLVIQPSVASDQPATCTFWVEGVSAEQPIDCGGTGQVDVPMWFTTYTVHVSATNPANSSPSQFSRSVQSDGKPMITDASTAFGPPANPCPRGETFCGGDSHSFPTTAYASSGGHFKTQYTPVRIECHQNGSKVSGYGAYTGGSTMWVRVANDSGFWMNTYYFGDPAHVIDDIPNC